MTLDDRISRVASNRRRRNPARVGCEVTQHHSAVREAAHVLYGIEGFNYEWVSVKRYMGIFHEVQPADNALRCLDCHGADGRLDWADLGYDADPMAAVLSPSH